MSAAIRLVGSTAIAALIVTACSAMGPGAQCQAGADCLSGICTADGRCGASATSGEAVSPPSNPADPSPPSSSSSSTSSSGDPATPNADKCVPNNDAIITRAEVPLAPGLHASFKVAMNVPIDTKGTVDPATANARNWDLSQPFPNDKAMAIDVMDPSGTWWAPKFAGATHALRLSAGSENLGVFQATPAASVLLGVVSPAGGSGRTELAYASPVATFSFPLEMGKTWTSSSDVTGVMPGYPAAQFHQSYAYSVDAKGTMKTSMGSFPVLRVRLVRTDTSAVSFAQTQRFFYFVSECFGTIAMASSSIGETSSEFTLAAEAWRVGP